MASGLELRGAVKGVERTGYPPISSSTGRIGGAAASQGRTGTSSAACVLELSAPDCRALPQHCHLRGAAALSFSRRSTARRRRLCRPACLPAGWSRARQGSRTPCAPQARTPRWAPFEFHTTSFWARRFAHETLLHRADATLATGDGFAVPSEVALDAVDEWMELDAFPQHCDIEPGKRELLGPGRALAFEATDVEAT